MRKLVAAAVAVIAFLVIRWVAGGPFSPLDGWVVIGCLAMILAARIGYCWSVWFPPKGRSR